MTPGARQNCPICKHVVCRSGLPFGSPILSARLWTVDDALGMPLDTVLNESEKEAERLGAELVEKSATVLSGLILPVLSEPGEGLGVGVIHDDFRGRYTRIVTGKPG